MDGWEINQKPRSSENFSQDDEVAFLEQFTRINDLFSFPTEISSSGNGNGNGIGIGGGPSQSRHVSTATATGQPRTNSNHSVFRRNHSTLSEPDRASRKREIDQAYRLKCKRAKEEMQSNLEILTVENESLKKENESLKNDNTLMNRTLTEQAKEIERLKNDLFHLKGEYEKQNVLVQTLSGLLADPVQLENEKLKDENASLRKNGNHNYNNTALLVEENAKLKLENKVLKVQIDALCSKIISDDNKKRGQETSGTLASSSFVDLY